VAALAAAVAAARAEYAMATSMIASIIGIAIKIFPLGSILLTGLFATYRYQLKSPLLNPMGSSEINL